MSTYSSMRPAAASDRTSSPLPRIVRSGPSVCLRAATVSAASPASSVECCQSNSRSGCRDATNFSTRFMYSVNGLPSVWCGQYAAMWS